ncbi:Calcium/calmodulin-dependent 3',5'-cyclic nucleotide phosphodiesterase 1 [Gryllus bimaculatus]|nr:Calcium/calmodulin-dependent 3',5'-cyclic nucleotide phosphodiesterase 1 [Gryllus bimaculatus]
MAPLLKCPRRAPPRVAEQGSLTIVRRSSGRARGRPPPGDEALDEVDMATDSLPPVDTPDACDKAALRLRCLLRQLEKGQVPAEVLQQNLMYATRVLEAVFIDETKRLADDDDELSEVQPDAVPHEVREWLASTFTRQLATTRRSTDEKPKFRTVAHAIRAGIFVDRIYRRQQPVKFLGYDLINRYGIIHKFKVPPATLEAFLSRVEEGYCRYRNPYHNNLHAADVSHAVHYMLCQTGLMNWLTDLEIFATLVAALIHDFEHTGTTNNFHVMSGTDTALLYNDRAVLENHHVSAAFRVDKSKALSLVLHCCDIAHPAKRWELHQRWTALLLEEFFRQGDRERDLGLPFSPLCDRNNTLVAESQIGFIEFIVEPSLAVCSDMMETVLGPIMAGCKTDSAAGSIAEEGLPSAPAPAPTPPPRQSSSEGLAASTIAHMQSPSSPSPHSPPTSPHRLRPSC